MEAQAATRESVGLKFSSNPEPIASFGVAACLRNLWIISNAVQGVLLNSAAGAFDFARIRRTIWNGDFTLISRAHPDSGNDTPQDSLHYVSVSLRLHLAGDFSDLPYGARSLGGWDDPFQCRPQPAHVRSLFFV